MSSQPLAAKLAPDLVKGVNSPARELVAATGERLEDPFLTNTWERDSRGEYPGAVVEAIDPDSMELDPLTFL